MLDGKEKRGMPKKWQIKLKSDRYKKKMVDRK